MSLKLIYTGYNSVNSFVRRECDIYFITSLYWSCKSSAVKRDEIQGRGKRRILPSYKSSFQRTWACKNYRITCAWCVSFSITLALSLSSRFLSICWFVLFSYFLKLISADLSKSAVFKSHKMNGKLPFPSAVCKQTGSLLWGNVWVLCRLLWDFIGSSICPHWKTASRETMFDLLSQALHQQRLSQLRKGLISVNIEQSCRGFLRFL